MTNNNEKCEILFFYSTSKYESVAARIAFKNLLMTNSSLGNYTLKEIDLDKDIEICKKFNVTGVPTTLFYYKNKLRARHLGEISKKELNILLIKVVKVKNR